MLIWDLSVKSINASGKAYSPSKEPLCVFSEIIDFVESFEKEQGVVVSFSNSAIRICGFSEKVNEIYTKCIEKM